MSAEQTRQLGIEFERRVQTMIPEKEILDKLDTETIYAFLNEYQDKYVNGVYKSLDNIPSGAKISSRVDRILQPLLTTCNYAIPADSTQDSKISPYSYNMELPSDTILYVRSSSKVSTTYSYDGDGSTKTLSHKPISQSDIQKYVDSPYDQLKIIPNPLAALNKNNTLTVIYDRYTTPEQVDVVYYRKPVKFTTLDTPVNCELPYEAFDDLVTGAVDMYVQYVAGVEARKRRMQEEQKQNQKSNQNRDEEQ